MTALDLFPSREAGPFGRRQKRARGARLPVTVVTGFLGAGKTTLVRHFLTTPQGRGTAVVINEYGAVGIDDALVRGTAEEVALIGNGCVCCTTRSDAGGAAAAARCGAGAGPSPPVRPRRDRALRPPRPRPDPADVCHRPRARRRILPRGRGRGRRRGRRARDARGVGRSAQAGD